MKICKNCKRELEESNFHKHKGYKDGLHVDCKECRKITNHENHLKNYNPLKRKEYHIKNKIKDNESNRIKALSYAKKDTDFYKRKNKKYKDYHRKYYKEWEAEQRKTNPAYRIKKALQSRLHDAIKEGCKSARTEELLGCTFEEARAYLESLFESGMSWDNYGDWEIDHIKPCASFDLSDPEQQRICFNYKNLQPLWKEDNRSKSDKLDWKKESA